MAQKYDAESTARFRAEQKIISLEQNINFEQLKIDEISGKYLNEIESVIIFEYFIFFIFQ